MTARRADVVRLVQKHATAFARDLADLLELVDEPPPDVSLEPVSELDRRRARRALERAGLPVPGTKTTKRGGKP